MSRDIPPMLHAPHADDCPSVGGDGGVYRLLAETIPHWRQWVRPGVCNCGRFYPPLRPDLDPGGAAATAPLCVPVLPSHGSVEEDGTSRASRGGSGRWR